MGKVAAGSLGLDTILRVINTACRAWIYQIMELMWTLSRGLPDQFRGMSGQKKKNAEGILYTVVLLHSEDRATVVAIEP